MVINMGNLIVLEGIDGSGKSTQFELLCSRLSAENFDFANVRFPQYDKPSAALINMYLGGEFGDDPDAVNAYAASSFFAVDRFASYKQDWGAYYRGGGLVLTDRYTTSNAIHQGAKLSHGQREDFFKWLYTYEFELMKLPAPDMVIYFDIEAEIAARRRGHRQENTGSVGDIHENDIIYMEKCAQCGRQAADFYGWRRISCVVDGRERAECEIHEEIYTIIHNFTDKREAPPLSAESSQIMDD